MTVKTHPGLCMKYSRWDIYSTYGAFCENNTGKKLKPWACKILRKIYKKAAWPLRHWGLYKSGFYLRFEIWGGGGGGGSHC